MLFKHRIFGPSLVYELSPRSDVTTGPHAIPALLHMMVYRVLHALPESSSLESML